MDEQAQDAREAGSSALVTPDFGAEKASETEDASMGAQIAREAGAAEQRVRDLRKQRASIGARITSEAKAAQQRIAELRERRTAINAEIKGALDEYGRLRRAAKLWED